MSERNSYPRVHYFNKQFLRKQEFVDEQSYQLAARRRHNIASHIWGIVVGLELTIEEDLLVVRSGMAIDGYGRELFLPTKRFISKNEFVRLGSNRLDISLTYENTPGEQAPAGYIACSNNDPDTFYRSNEIPRIIVERAGPGRVNSSRPKGVPPAILDSVNNLVTTDDPLSVWPVHLGRLTYNPEETDPAKQIVIDATERRYAGVTAEVIDHPSNPSRVELGKSSLQDDQRVIGETTFTYKKSNSDRGFAIFVPPKSPGEVELFPRLEMLLNGQNYLRGDSTINGNLQLARGSAVQFTDAVPVDDTVPREQPSIYRTAPDGDDQLRIDLGNLSTQNCVLVIGFTAEDGSFQPSLRVENVQAGSSGDPQPLVTIFGDLKMEGLLDAPNQLDRSLSTETVNALQIGRAHV